MLLHSMCYGNANIAILQAELYPTASSSMCCWYTQTCKLVFPEASYTQRKIQEAPGLTFETATVWAGSCNQRDWTRGFLLETRTTEWELGSDCGSGLDSKSGCRFSAGPGKKPWTSTLLEAWEAFCAELPSGHLKGGLAGGSGKRKLHLQGPGDAERQPPKASGVSGLFLARTSALPGELWRPELEAEGRKRLKLTSGLWMAL